MFARISSARDTLALQQTAVTAIDSEVRQAIGVLVARAERVANGEARELPDQRLGPGVHGNEIGMLDPVNAQHLLYQQLGIRNDLDLARPLRIRDFEGLEQSRVLGDVVGRAAEVAADLDDLTTVGSDVDAVTGRAGVAPRRAVDEGRELQDVGLST